MATAQEKESAKDGTWEMSNHTPVAEEDTDVVHGKPTGTQHDKNDMSRLGKKQEFRRNFRFYSILGFTCTLMCTWEAMLATSSFGLQNGGLAGVIWVYLGTVVMMMCVIASMADMASMAPTSGGQYHWVSEFAPPSAQRFLSYMVGWLCALGWQAGTASTAYISATIFLGLINLNHPEFVATQWQQTLFTIAMALVAFFFNTYGAKQLALLEGLILVLHIFGFFAILVPLWVLAPTNSPEKVFTEFSNYGGWPTIGTACIVGQIAPIYAFAGPDAATHMSEEIRDASRIVPICMIATGILNAILGLVMTVTYCFCITDLDAALHSDTGYAFIEVFHAATGSKGGTTVMASIVATLMLCACISILATASRQTFAFARDDGMPFSPFFRKVSTIGTELPLNAVLFSLSITVLLAIINIGSNAAFNAIVSLLVVALYLSYFISIACILIKRIRKEPLPPSRWSLGRAAIPLNVVSLLYIAFAFVMSLFPLTATVTLVDMNWCVLILAVVMAFAVISYLLYGRNVYKGPVMYVRRWDSRGE